MVWKVADNRPIQKAQKLLANLEGILLTKTS